MDPALSQQRELGAGAASSPSAACTGSPDQLLKSVEHHGTSLLGFILAAAALFTLAVVCCALLLLVMRWLARGCTANEGSTASEAGAEQGSNSECCEDGVVDISKNVALQMSGATPVLFPGEERPRTLAVPSQLTVLQPLQHDTHVVCINLVQLDGSHSQRSYN